MLTPDQLSLPHHCLISELITLPIASRAIPFLNVLLERHGGTSIQEIEIIPDTVTDCPVERVISTWFFFPTGTQQFATNALWSEILFPDQYCFRVLNHENTLQVSFPYNDIPVIYRNDVLTYRI